MSRAVRAFGGVTMLAAVAVITLPGTARAQSADLDSALALHWRGQQDSASALLLDLATRRPGDPTVRAWLAEIDARRDDPMEATVWARQALALDSCDAFAHDVLARVFNPQFSTRPGTDDDSTWAHARAAVRCGPDDGNVWVTMLVQAIRHGDRDRLNQALDGLARTAFFARSVVVYDSATLRTLPRNAVILMGGDLDFFPTLMLQHIDGVRADVAVVSYPLLNTLWYPEWVHDVYGLPVPPRSELDTLQARPLPDSTTAWRAEHIVTSWRRAVAQGQLGRPLVWALSAGAHAREGSPGALRFAGPWFVLDPTLRADTVDYDAAAGFFDGLHVEDLAGADVTAQDRSLLRRETPEMFAKLAAFGMAFRVGALRERGDSAAADSMLASLHRLGDAAGIRDWIAQLESTMRPGGSP